MKASAVEGVWKFYGDYAALREVSFDIEPGQCVASSGRNGAGKTTLIRISAGSSRPSRGVVKVFDTDFQNRTTRNRIGISGHGIAIYDELSAYENSRSFASSYGSDKPDAAANHWSERTGLDRVKDSSV
ncbi:hypothetical protein OY671_012292, partial [Metschnikowia pulcherrima]